MCTQRVISTWCIVAFFFSKMVRRKENHQTSEKRNAQSRYLEKMHTVGSTHLEVFSARMHTENTIQTTYKDLHFGSFYIFFPNNQQFLIKPVTNATPPRLSISKHRTVSVTRLCSTFSKHTFIFSSFLFRLQVREISTGFSNRFYTSIL